MTKTFISGDPINLFELSKKIRRPESTLRIILGRSEFDKFHLGRGYYTLNRVLIDRIYNYIELRKARCCNMRSLERTQKLLLKLRKEL